MTIERFDGSSIQIAKKSSLVVAFESHYNDDSMTGDYTSENDNNNDAQEFKTKQMEKIKTMMSLGKLCLTQDEMNQIAQNYESLQYYNIMNDFAENIKIRTNIGAVLERT